MYELVVVVSVFKRWMWGRCRKSAPRPRAERRFVTVLPEEYTPIQVSKALSEALPRMEQWLRDVGADLVRDMVVTVYSIEDASCEALDDHPV